MTPQEAYNRGLDDAENRIIDNLIGLLNDRNDIPFPNPKLEIVRQVIKERSDYHHQISKRINNVGYSFRKKLNSQKEMLEKAK